MPSLYLLIPMGVAIVFGAIALFLWAAQSGQFDELGEQSTRMPDDDA